MKIVAFSALLWLLAIAAHAQDLVPAQKVDFANWVIESNIKTPKTSTVKFYNAKQELIYQELIEGKRLDVRKEKIKKKLNQLLVQLVNKPIEINQYNLVALSL